VVTAMDTLPAQHPEWFTRANVLHQRLIAGRALRSATVVLCPTEFAHDQVCAAHGVDPTRTAITPLGVNARMSPEPIDEAAASIGGQVDALFNVAGVSSGIKDPLRVVTINFLGTRQLTEALVPTMPPGSAIANVSSLAASAYRENSGVTAGLLDTVTMAEGVEWCQRNPEALADGGGYRLSKEAIILYGLANVAVLGAKGIRINCTAPGVTDTPILDQLRSAYGQEFLDAFRTPLGGVSEPSEQAAVLVFRNSKAASYITGQVIWVDGGTIGETDLAGSVPRR